jgi:hypothetical protein
MSKTVYVEVTSSYSRSTWDDLGSTNYNPGDRVDYFDGSRNRIFVCINSNNSTTEPQNNPTDWAPAGSKEYPFLLIDSATNLRVINNSEWTLHGISSSTVNFLAEELGTWAPDNPIGGNATYQADGAGGTIILGDGRYAWDYPTYAMWWPNNCTIQAKNKQKAYIITTGNYWGGDNVTWKDVVIYCTKTSNNTPGGYGGFTHNLDSCLFTQETPWGSLYAAKQEPSSSLWTRVCGGFNGGYMRNCTFDYQYRGPSYWFNLSATSTGTIENNTFYCRVKHNQYNLIYGGGNVLWSNNIFHIKYLQNGHPNQVVHQSAFSGEVSGLNTQGVNTFYLENDSDVGGTLNNNINGGVTIDPLFINADGSNFSLRPSSPLIGGYQPKDSLSLEYPEGFWYDSNHTPTFATRNYSLDSGDGNNYTFSGDATGTDPKLDVKTGDTLIFTNNTGGHPIGIKDSSGALIAQESGGILTFSTLREGVYRYECQAPHPNMSNEIVVTRGVGSYDNPHNNFLASLHVSGTLLVKNGTHTLPRQESDLAADLKIIGENTKNTIIFSTGTSGTSYNPFFNGQNCTSFSIKNLTLRYNGFSNSFGLIYMRGHLDIGSCNIEQTDDSINSSATTRGWFLGGSSATIKNSVITGKSTNALVFGGDYNQDTFREAIIENCTFICKRSAANIYGTSNQGLSSTTNFSVKNTIHIGTGSTTLWHRAPTGGSNFYYNVNLSSTPSSDDFIGTEIPAFISETDYRLRPTSELIGGTQTYSESASEWYVDLVNGDDANDGKTPATAMLTVAAAHTASINRDTIYIVNQELTLSSNLTLPGGRDYKPASYCDIDGSNAYGIILSDTGALETGLNNFNFTNLRGTYALLSIEASTSLSVFKIESCNFQGTVTNSRSAAIGGATTGSCRSAADGSELKNCTIDCTWGTASTAGSSSSGFVAVDRMNLIGCTFHVGKNTPISNALFLVGSGGVGAWSHGPPYGPVLVKNCILYGNEKMPYSSTSSGNGSSLGFVSNVKATTTTANYLIHNTCIYGVRGTFGIDEADRPYRGSLITEYLSGPDGIIIYDFDPKFVGPDNGNFSLRPTSPLIGMAS